MLAHVARGEEPSSVLPSACDELRSPNVMRSADGLKEEVVDLLLRPLRQVRHRVLVRLVFPEVAAVHVRERIRNVVGLREGEAGGRSINGLGSARRLTTKAGLYARQESRTFRPRSPRTQSCARARARGGSWGGRAAPICTRRADLRGSRRGVRCRQLCCRQHGKETD